MDTPIIETLKEFFQFPNTAADGGYYSLFLFTILLIILVAVNRKVPIKIIIASSVTSVLGIVLFIMELIPDSVMYAQIVILVISALAHIIGGK